MSWHFSRVMVEEFLALNCSGTDASAQSSKINTPDLYCCSDKTTGCCRRSLSGMTLQRSTVQFGEDVLTSYLEAFPVKTSALQARAQASMAQNLRSGWIWRESSMKYDRRSHSWKTRRSSLFEDWTECSLTLPRSGTLRNGELWERYRLEPLTIGKGFGSSQPMNITATSESAQGLDAGARKIWPTLRASDWRRGASPADIRRGCLPAVAGGRLNPAWTEWLMGFPLGWTELKVLEMPKFLSWQLTHLDSLRTD